MPKQEHLRITTLLLGPGATEPTLTSRERVWEKECAASFHLQVFIFPRGVEAPGCVWGQRGDGGLFITGRRLSDGNGFKWIQEPESVI